MKLFQFAFCCVAGLILCSCGNTFKGETKSLAPAPKKTVNIAVSALAAKSDLVCGMNLKNGDVADTAIYQGKVYGFCGSGCKDEFVKAPNQYLNQQ